MFIPGSVTLKEIFFSWGFRERESVESFISDSASEAGFSSEPLILISVMLIGVAIWRWSKVWGWIMSRPFQSPKAILSSGKLREDEGLNSSEEK